MLGHCLRDVQRTTTLIIMVGTIHFFNIFSKYNLIETGKLWQDFKVCVLLLKDGIGPGRDSDLNLRGISRLKKYIESA